MEHKRLDILTNINLLLIKENNNNFDFWHFKNEKGKELEYEHGPYDAKYLRDYMQNCGVINVNGEICQITPFGFEVLEKYSSWTNYKETKEKEESDSNKKDSERQNLKDEIDKLNYESLKHKETIREQEDRIRNLNEQLTFINLMKAYWWVIGIGFSIGGILGGILVKIW